MPDLPLGVAGGRRASHRLAARQHFEANVDGDDAGSHQRHRHTPWQLAHMRAPMPPMRTTHTNSSRPCVGSCCLVCVEAARCVCRRVGDFSPTMCDGACPVHSGCGGFPMHSTFSQALPKALGSRPRHSASLPTPCRPSYFSLPLIRARNVRMRVVVQWGRIHCRCPGLGGLLHFAPRRSAAAAQVSQCTGSVVVLAMVFLQMDRTGFGCVAHARCENIGRINVNWMHSPATEAPLQALGSARGLASP